MIALLALMTLTPAFAEDGDNDPGLLTDPSSIDLGGEDAAGALTYAGSQNGRAANYVVGKPVSISHSNGNLTVHCIDSDRFTASLQYTVYGSAEGPMESFGNGIGMAVSGDSKSGSVKTRVPSKTSGVSRAEVDLTVSVPRGVTALSVTNSGKGWVQVTECTGKVTVSAGYGGAYVSGALTAVSAGASGGDVKVVMAKDAVLSGASGISAPGGNATLELSGAQGGKLTAKGGEVSVQQVVMGTNTPTLVQGDMGVTGPTISISAKNRVEVIPN